MKRNLLFSLLTACVLSTGILHAQMGPDGGAIGPYNYTDIGVKGGANFQNIIGYPFTQTYNPGAMAGLYIERRRGVFGIKAEVTGSTAQFLTEFPVAHDYTTNKNKIADSTTKGDFTNLYVNVPVMFEVNTGGKRLSLLFGAQYSYLISTMDNSDLYTKTWNTEKLFKQSNVSLLFGMEITFLKAFKLGATFTQGLQDINNQKVKGISDSWMTTSGQAYLNYRIKRKFRGK